MKEIVEKWSHTGMLNGCSNKQVMAVALESQRLFNEEGNGDSPQFKRCSLPFVRRVLSQFPLVKSSIFEEALWYYFDFNFNDELGKSSAQMNLDKEAEVCANLSAMMVKEIREEIGNKFVFYCFDYEDGEVAMNYSPG